MSTVLAKAIISLLVSMPGDGGQYAMQTWEPRDAAEFVADWKACNNQAIELQGKLIGRQFFGSGIKAKCQIQPAAAPTAEPAAQTIRF